MHNLHRPQRIHPADCACPRCDPQLLGGRRRLHLEHALIGLIVASAFVAAAFAISGAN